MHLVASAVLRRERDLLAFGGVFLFLFFFCLCIADEILLLAEALDVAKHNVTVWDSD